MAKQRKIIVSPSSFIGRIFLGLFLVQLLLAPILIITNVYFTQQTIKEQFINESRLTAFLISVFISNELKHGDAEAISLLFDDVLLGGQTVFLTLERDTQDDIASSMGTSLDDISYTQDMGYSENNDSIYFLSVPISDPLNNETVTLKVGFDETFVNASIKKSTYQTIAIIMAYMALSLIISAIISRRMVAPLQALRMASKKIASGHYEEHFSTASKIDEIRELGEDLENMRGELVSQAMALEHQSMHDVLTQLPNRSLLNDRITQAILAATRTPESFTLFLMDLNNFKEVNDTLGHHAGDSILQEVATRIREAVRPSDTVARLGGDEFAVHLCRTEEKEAIDVALRIQEAIKPPFQIDQHNLHIGVSIGIAFFPQHGDSNGDLLKRADVAMYAAKSEKKPYVIYEPTLDQHSMRRLELSNELRKGILEDELILFFQPKIKLEEKQQNLAGVEALVRWQHKERGLIPPDEFITIAERTGVIDALTLDVTRKALRQVHAWSQQGLDVTVAVNISTRNLMDQEFAEKILTICNEENVKPQQLELEITESSILQDPLRAIKVLEGLHKLGIKLSIDDFGTGYSSLAYLKELPVTDLKIDKSFIMDMLEDSNDATIVKATIEMAHNLGLKVVAEGVENHETLMTLKDLGCDMIQGYFISKPLPTEDFNEWFSLNSWQY